MSQAAAHPAGPAPSPATRVHLSPRAESVVLLVLAGLTASGPLSIDLYLPAFSAIAADLQAGTGQVQLTMAVYFVGAAVGQLIYGPLADRLGRRVPLMLGMGLYTLASLGCALAPSIEALWALRLLQALGGASGMVITRAMVRDLFAPTDAARVFSLLLLIMGVAPIVAPALGGVLLTVGSWRLIFAALVAYGVAALVAARLVLPETRPAHVRAAAGPAEPVSDGLRQLLGDRSFVTGTLAGACAHGALFAYLAGSSVAIIDHFGVAPTSFGYWFGANAAGLIGASQLNRAAVRRWSLPTVLRAAALLAWGWALILVGTTWAQPTSFALFFGPLFVHLAFFGFISPNGTAVALSAQSRRAGLASSVLGAVQFGIGAAAAALVGAFADGSPAPMVALIAVMATATAVVARFVVLSHEASDAQR